jgi:2'-5' RNA ligase
MRLFAALPVPDPASQEIAALLERLRASDWPVRWVGDEKLHVTLKFYGEVAPERLEVIEESVRLAARGAGPMPHRLDALGAFPSVQHARELLQDRLERAGEAIGFPPEGRPFRPHVTLGRVREGHRIPANAFQEYEVERLPLLVEELVLYESLLSPDGPRYEARLTLPLVS